MNRVRNENSFIYYLLKWQFLPNELILDQHRQQGLKRVILVLRNVQFACLNLAV